MMLARQSFNAFGSTFTVDSEYEFVKEIGYGVSGLVVAAQHRVSGEKCAIKKVINIGNKTKSLKQCLREIKLLRHFRRHENVSDMIASLTRFCMDGQIVCVRGVDIVFQPNGSFGEVYIYQELMETDLHRIILSGHPLTDEHLQWMLYQTLRGLKYIHSSNVLHRDIKPGNLLVNADCDVKICDFGLARGYTSGGSASKSAGDQDFLTGYVAMRWYRAPEIMLSFVDYTTAIDVWSIGCILAELLDGKPIFKGKDYVDQLNQILHYLGTPSEDILCQVGSPLAQDYIRSLPIKPRVPFATLYSHANPLAVDLLTQMLCIDPSQRVSCEQALNHPYLQAWHDPADEPICEAQFDSSFEEEDSAEGVKSSIVEEVRSFQEEVAQARAAGQPNRQDSLPIPSSDEIMDSPLRGHGDVPRATPDSAMTPSRSPSPIIDSSNLLQDSELSLSRVSTRPTTSSLVPTAAEVDHDDSVHVAVPQAHDAAALVSGHDDATSSSDSNTHPNDLTNQITRDGHDPVASGGFADIYRGTLQENGESVKVAIKTIRMYSGEDGDFFKKQKRLRREIKVWLNLRHANVLPLLGMAMGFGRFPAMVCPWAENGALTSYLEDRHGHLSVIEILGLLNNVASGLQYLHSCSVVHGDLSGSNVLICEDGRACITDFGLSMLLTELGGSTFATSLHAQGTLRWTAPELLDLEVPEDDMEEESPRVSPTTQSDIYSFGSVMLQILSGKVPYHYYTRDAQVIHAVSKGVTPRRPSSVLVTERRWTFIRWCWFTRDCARPRPSSEEIMAFAGEELAVAHT